MPTFRDRLVDPERRWRVVGFVLLVGLLWEIQYALRYVYLVPVWDIAALHEMLLYRLQSQPDRSVWDVALNFVVNGHWPLIPFFAYYADFAFDGATGRIPMALSWLALLGIAPAMAWAAVPDRPGMARASRFVLPGTAIAIVMFWPAQMETVISPMQVLISASLLFGILALRSATGDASPRRYAITIGCTLASMFCFGYGVVLWPCLLLLFALQRRWRTVAGTAVLALLSLWVYQRTTVGAGFNPLAALLQHASAVTGYCLAQAGAGFAYLVQQPMPRVAQWAGAVAVIVQVGLSVLLWRSGRWPERSLRFLWLLSLWLIGMMLLTGLGRHSLGPLQAMNTRYLIVSSLYWLSLGMLAWRLFDGAKLARRIVAGAAVTALVVLLVGVPLYVERMQAVRINQRVATLALTLGVTELDSQGQPHAVLHPWSLANLYAYYRAQRMTIYREPWSNWLGSTGFAARFGNAVPRRCEFVVDARTPAREGERLIGWIHSPDTQASPREVLFVNDDTIVGMAFVLMDRPELATHFKNRAAAASGFYGFLPTQKNGEIAVHGLFEDGSMCRAGSVPALLPAAPPAA